MKCDLRIDPLISVIIPVYKVEQYLHRCIDSVLKQTYKNIEIVLVDDGSPDTCPFICDQYEQRYSQVKAFHKPNGGLGDARNYGVEKACGELIAFIDSDDWVDQDYICHLYYLREMENADISVTRLKHEIEGQNSDERSKKADLSYRIVSGIDAMVEVYCHEGIGWTACGKLFSKELLLKYPFPSGYYEDCAIMYKILFSTKKVVIGDKVQDYHYMSNTGSILKSNLNTKHMRIFDICDEFEEFITNNCPQLQYLSILLRRSAVTQMLKRQKMSTKDFNNIFIKYRALFRRNLIKVFSLDNISIKNKMMYFVHCSYPMAFRIINKLH